MYNILLYELFNNFYLRIIEKSEHDSYICKKIRYIIEIIIKFRYAKIYKNVKKD